MPFAPYSNIITVIMLIAVVIGMLFNPDTRISAFIGLGFVILNTSYILIKTKRAPAKQPEIETTSQDF